MTLIEVIRCVILLCGAGFFIIGTIGLLRFPDTYTRIHALTKVDNLGLGLIVLGLLPGAAGLMAAFKLVLIWLFVLAASATAGHLVAHATYYRERSQRGHWRSSEDVERSGA